MKSEVKYGVLALCFQFVASIPYSIDSQRYAGYQNRPVLEPSLQAPKQYQYSNQQYNTGAFKNPTFQQQHQIPVQQLPDVNRDYQFSKNPQRHLPKGPPQHAEIVNEKYSSQQNIPHHYTDNRQIYENRPDINRIAVLTPTSVLNWGPLIPAVPPVVPHDVHLHNINNLRRVDGQNHEVAPQPKVEEIEIPLMPPPPSREVHEVVPRMNNFERFYARAADPIAQIPQPKKPYRPPVDIFLSQPKVKEALANTRHKKRYLVIHPDGTVEHVDKLETIAARHPNYLLVNGGDIAHNVISDVTPSLPSQLPAPLFKPQPELPIVKQEVVTQQELPTINQEVVKLGKTEVETGVNRGNIAHIVISDVTPSLPSQLPAPVFRPQPEVPIVNQEVVTQQELPTINQEVVKPEKTEVETPVEVSIANEIEKPKATALKEDSEQQSHKDEIDAVHGALTAIVQAITPNNPAITETIITDNGAVTPENVLVKTPMEALQSSMENKSFEGAVEALYEAFSSVLPEITSDIFEHAQTATKPLEVIFEKDDLTPHEKHEVNVLDQSEMVSPNHETQVVSTDNSLMPHEVVTDNSSSKDNEAVFTVKSCKEKSVVLAHPVKTIIADVNPDKTHIKSDSDQLQNDTNTEEPSVDNEKLRLNELHKPEKDNQHPLWFKTSDPDFWEHLAGKENDVIYFFQVHNQPKIERDVRTTIHPNGTIVEDIIETYWAFEGDEPTITKSRKVTHPEEL